MKALIFLTTTMLLLTGFYISPSFIVAVFGVFTSLLLLLLTLVFGPYFTELMSTDNRPPVVGPILNQLIHFQELYDYMTSIAKKHPTFRFIRPTHSEVYTADPENVEYILRTNFVNYTKGEYNTCIMKDLFGNGIFTVDGAKWRHQRKLASFEFSTKVLRDFSSVIFKSNTAKLVKNISLLAAAENAMDLQDLLMKSTLDSMFKVGFGFDLDTLSGLDEASNQFMKAFDDSNALVYWRFMDLLWKVKRHLSIGSEATLKDYIRIIDSFVYKLIHNKREQMKNENHYRNKEDILSRFLTESEKDPKNMTDEYLRDISLSFVIAGKDTSANTLTWFFYMLCKHPLIQEKVAEEVKKATEANDGTSIEEFGSKLTEVVLDKMHYLHAAISETLRLYPAVPLDSKCAEKDDVLPDGFKIKKGDGVGYIPYPMGRMTYIWGDDAEEFRPERWLDNGIFRPESPFKFTAFQGGPRICLGKEFAYRQMKMMFQDSKCAEKDDVLPDGFKIKKGDGVGYIPYPMGRMTYIWGDDAEEFRPERWLDNGIFRPESPFKFTAFQGGPRICLGKEFAYRQMKILAAYLVYFFKFKLVDEGRDATYRTMFTLLGYITNYLIITEHAAEVDLYN